MANTTMSQASKDYGGFYVPQFKILVQGESLPSTVLHDIVEVTYKDKLEEIDSCELVVNNWDADHNCFKYIGAENLDNEGHAVDKGAVNSDLWTLFDPCTKDVELLLGYASCALSSMLKGNFVTYEPSFTASGPPVLSVRMLNKMHKLRTKKYDGQYTKAKIDPFTDGAIAQWIGKQPDPDTKQPRFPMPIQADPKLTGRLPNPEYVIQKSQYDIDFLWQRARLNGLDIRIKYDDKLKKEVLSFAESTTPERPVYELHWGRSLIDFKPTLTVGNQYKSVTTRYFDRATQKPVEVKLDFNSKEVGKINKDLDYLLRQCDPREETVVDMPFYSKDQATEFCARTFADRRKVMVKATGTTVGLPELRAGSKISIGGEKKSLGSRLSGTYFVTATTHTFNNSGYTTRFEARREDQGPGQ
jgi:hypothetical protein